MRLAHFFRPRYANVVATAALIVAMSGTAYAVNTVHTSDIVDGAVTNVKIADSAVGTAKVAANSLTLADIKGADTKGTIGFSLGANACGTLLISVSGAE